MENIYIPDGIPFTLTVNSDQYQITNGSVIVDEIEYSFSMGRQVTVENSGDGVSIIRISEFKDYAQHDPGFLNYSKRGKL